VIEARTHTHARMHARARTRARARARAHAQVNTWNYTTVFSSDPELKHTLLVFDGGMLHAVRYATCGRLPELTRSESWMAARTL
jgi:hypothetical protein